MRTISAGSESLSRRASPWHWGIVGPNVDPEEQIKDMIGEVDCQGDARGNRVATLAT